MLKSQQNIFLALQLGMRSMFGGDANLNGLLESTGEAGSIMVSKVIHKAFIDVNEVGSEAGAATSKLLLLMTIVSMIMFVV